MPKAKAPKKTAPTKKTSAKKAATKITAIKEVMTKTEILTHLSDKTGLSRKEISEVLNELKNLTARHLRKGGAGQFRVPNMGVILKSIRKPATKARKGINPFTKEPTVFKAKPARMAYKVRALKALKEMVD